MTFAEQVLFVRKKLYFSRSDMAKNGCNRTNDL